MGIQPYQHAIFYTHCHTIHTYTHTYVIKLEYHYTYYQNL